MKHIKKCLIWYFMYSKRLLHKVSFIVLLCLIPALVPLSYSIMSSENSSMLHIVLCAQDNDPTSTKAIDSLTESNGIIKYTLCSSEVEARDTVRNHKADAAWIFVSDFGAKLDSYTAKEHSDPLVHIIMREDSVPLQISREMLYGSFYADLSYSLYRNFLLDALGSDEDVSESEFRNVYTTVQRKGNIINVKQLNDEVKRIHTNYLTAPIRGLLSLMVVLCTVAAAMYYLQDQAENKYAWLPPHKRLIPAFASCLSAAVFSAAAVFVALQISGVSVGFGRELLAIILYLLTSTAFCLVLCTLFRSPGNLGTTIPGIVIAMLVLSPVFFSGKGMQFIRVLLPSHYYLYSVYDSSYFIWSVVYCLAAFALAVLLNIIVNMRPRKSVS